MYTNRLKKLLFVSLLLVGCSPEPEKIRVYWQRNVEPDIVEYRIYWKKLDDEFFNIVITTDTSAVLNVGKDKVVVQVTAVDSLGHESQKSVEIIK